MPPFRFQPRLSSSFHVDSVLKIGHDGYLAESQYINAKEMVRLQCCQTIEKATHVMGSQGTCIMPE